MASNILGNLVNYSDEDDESDSELVPEPPQPRTSEPQNHHTNKRKLDTSIMDLHGSNTKKPHTSIANVVSKPAVRPASLPEQPAQSKYIEDGHDIASPMEGDEDEQEQKRRTLLKPNGIPGVDSWGIPPEPSGDCDPDVEAKIEHFLWLRESGTRFNEHLQHSKAFRNPHIYEKLVEFVELDEYSSNFPKEQFDPHGLGADINDLLEAQKKAAEERAHAQQNRTNIQFVASNNNKPVPGTPPPSQQPDKFADAVARAARIASKLSSQAPRRE